MRPCEYGICKESECSNIDKCNSDVSSMFPVRKPKIYEHEVKLYKIKAENACTDPCQRLRTPNSCRECEFRKFVGVNDVNCEQKRHSRECYANLWHFHVLMKGHKRMNNRIKAIGRNELARRYAELLDASTVMQNELSRWIDGYIDVSAKYYKVNPKDRMFERLPSSTMEQIKERATKIPMLPVKPDTDESSNVEVN